MNNICSDHDVSHDSGREIWEELQLELSDCANLKFKEFDCAHNQDLCHEYSIRNNPSYLTFEKNELLDVYYGQKTEEAMRNYCLTLCGFRTKRSLPDEAATEAQPEHTSIRLTPETFDEEVKHGITLVM